MTFDVKWVECLGSYGWLLISNSFYACDFRLVDLPGGVDSQASARRVVCMRRASVVLQLAPWRGGLCKTADPGLESCEVGPKTTVNQLPSGV